MNSIVLPRTRTPGVRYYHHTLMINCLKILAPWYWNCLLMTNKKRKVTMAQTRRERVAKAVTRVNARHGRTLKKLAE